MVWQLGALLFKGLSLVSGRWHSVFRYVGGARRAPRPTDWDDVAHFCNFKDRRWLGRP